MDLKAAIDAYFGAVFPDLSSSYQELTPRGVAKHVVFGVAALQEEFSQNERVARFALERLLLLSVIDAYPLGGLVVWRRLPEFSVVPAAPEEGRPATYRATIRLGVAGFDPAPTEFLTPEGGPVPRYILPGRLL